MDDVITIMKEYKIESQASRTLYRKEIYPLHRIFDMVLFISKSLAKAYKIDYDNDMMNMASDRYKLFKTKGVKCCECGIEGKYFAKERMHTCKTYHFNLYAIDKNGNEMLMTKDHIIPKSLGGKDAMDNYQVMCYECNYKKGNGLTTAVNVEKVQSRYIKKESYPIDVVMSYVYIVADRRTGWWIDFDGDRIRMANGKFILYKLYGTKCTCCGLEGKYFTKEKFEADEDYTLNLYGWDDENNTEILISPRHIIPTIEGGTDRIMNKQIMCMKCNYEKYNRKPDAEVIKRIKEEEKIFDSNTMWHLYKTGMTLDEFNKLSLFKKEQSELKRIFVDMGFDGVKARLMNRNLFEGQNTFRKKKEKV